MFLLELLLAFVGISQLAHSSPPKIPFQQLLDTCTNPETSNSTQCQYFWSTYQWRNEDIKIVFDKVTRPRSAYRSPAIDILEERLMNRIGNPNFDLALLGEHSFFSAVNSQNEPMAFAIWPQLQKYKNQSLDFYCEPTPFRQREYKITDLQLYECYNSVYAVMHLHMLQLLKKMVSDQPDCLFQRNNLIPLYTGSSIDVREFLVDQGVKITPWHLQYQDYPHEGFEWALLNYKHSNVLINNSIRNGSEVLAIAIWQFLKEKNYSEQLFQICNTAVFDVVKTNKVELLKMMLRDCPECIQSNGNTLMDIAIKGDHDSMALIQLLNLYGVEIPPSYIHKSPFFKYPANIDPAIFNCKQEFPHRGAAYDYFMKALEENKKEICNKISSQQNIPGIVDILPECQD